jgi:hypothetical protein
MTGNEMPDRLLLQTPEEARILQEKVQDAAAAACMALSELMSDHQPIDVLRAIKFRQVGFAPLDVATRVNFIEQVHQTFRHLVALRGVEYLFDKHPSQAPYSLSMGGDGGHDIQSADGNVIAETVAVVTPDGNKKLRYDIDRVKASPAELRYVFYLAEEDGATVSDTEIEIIAVTL